VVSSLHLGQVAGICIILIDCGFNYFLILIESYDIMALIFKRVDLTDDDPTIIIIDANINEVFFLTYEGSNLVVERMPIQQIGQCVYMVKWENYSVIYYCSDIGTMIEEFRFVDDSMVHKERYEYKKIDNIKWGAVNWDEDDINELRQLYGEERIQITRLEPLPTTIYTK